MISNIIGQSQMKWIFEEPLEAFQSYILEGLKSFGNTTLECRDRIYEYLPVCPRELEFFCKQDNSVKAVTVITALAAIALQFQNRCNLRAQRAFSNDFEKIKINNMWSKVFFLSSTISLIYFYVQEHIFEYDA